MDAKNLKVAYLGGGSRAWARKFMCDLALEEELGGEVCLYDIDLSAAKDNQIIGNRIAQSPNCVASWKFTVAEKIEQALGGADFVVISVLPATFEEMRSDVHWPEKYGILQTVGDTVGPGGYLRAMRCVPIFRGFAAKIRECCPHAWVINYTNPMTLCVRTLFEEFPEIKLFGCCHEVFGTQNLLISALREVEGVAGATRHEIDIDVGGINHFTWISRAEYKGQNLFPVLDKLIERTGEAGYADPEFTGTVMECHNLVKFELYKQYGILAAAGDRHLSEFLPNKWFLSSEEYVRSKGFRLTPVSWRIEDQQQKIRLTADIVAGRKTFDVAPSGEEGVRQIKALCGLADFVTNVNTKNSGQMPGYPLGAVVETNAKLSKNSLMPLPVPEFPKAVNALILPHVYRQEGFIDAAFRRDARGVLAVLQEDPQCCALRREEVAKMFWEMYNNTRGYLADYWEVFSSLK